MTDVVVLAKSRRPPKGYTLAGEVDGMMICFKVSTIPDGYGRLSHSQSSTEMSSAEAANKRNSQLYPPLAAPIGPHSQSIGDLASAGGPHGQAAAGVSAFTIRQSAVNHVKGVDGVPFQLNPVFARALDAGKVGGEGGWGGRSGFKKTHKIKISGRSELAGDPRAALPADTQREPQARETGPLLSMVCTELAPFFCHCHPPA